MKSTKLKLQSKLEKKLLNSKFRFLNQSLFTKDDFTKEDIEIYHKGFQSAMKKWPKNPYNLIYNYLDIINEKDNINNNLNWGDIGCGDTPVFKYLRNKYKENIKIVLKTGEARNNSKKDINSKRDINSKIINFYNFDKFPTNSLITQSDSSNLPIENQFFDILIFSLSLMSKNIFSIIKEANRVLKLNGKLIILETANRIDNKFNTNMKKMGFKLIKKKEEQLFCIVVYERVRECEEIEFNMKEFKYKNR